ncbi:MAG: hypothetical protein ACOC9T_00075 [Myxococcota bacterium]
MTHTYTIQPKAPETAGGLHGWEAQCSCGERASFSVRQLAEQHGRDHAEYMAAKEARSRRRR